MVTVDYIEILQGCADLCGLDRDNLSTVEQAILRNLLSKRLATAWINQLWPDLCDLQKRYFRPVYAAGTAYAVLDEVYFPQTQKCYQALVATTGNAPADSADTTDYTRWAVCEVNRSADDYDATAAYVAGSQVYSPGQDAFFQAIASSTGVAVTDGTKWSLIASFSRYVSKDQVGETAIGAVLSVKDKSERETLEAREVVWSRTGNGIQVLSDVPFVWVHFRLRAPALTGSKWSATGIYAEGQQAYYKSAAVAGNLYNALATTAAGESPETTAAKWELVSLPMDFKQYLEAGAAGDYLAGTDDTQSDRLRGLAEVLLGDVAGVLLGQEGQNQRTEVGTR